MADVSDMTVDFGNVFDEPQYSEEIELAIKLMRAASAVDNFVDYAEENDLDVDDVDQNYLASTDAQERAVIHSFLVFARSMDELGELLDDGDDENPFKVSDGDDPIR